MVKKVELNVGKPFKGKRPLRTGPERSNVIGTIKAINLASGTVDVESNGLVKTFWNISIEDAICQNEHLEKEED